MVARERRRPRKIAGGEYRNKWINNSYIDAYLFLIHVLFTCHSLITAAMQKFNEAKQATDATAEEEEKTAETAEAKKDDLAENNETSVDETSTSAEELHDRGQGTVTPAAKGGGTHWRFLNL